MAKNKTIEPSKYEIVCEEELSALKIKVNAMIEMGYAPVGGIAYITDFGKDLGYVVSKWYQAMMKMT